MRKSVMVCGVGLALVLAGCAMTKPEAAADLNAAFNVAAAAEAAYEAHPGADPTKVAQAKRLLIAAQAALTAWENSQSPGNQAAASAAVAALVAYSAAATVQATPAPAAVAPAAPAASAG